MIQTYRFRLSAPRNAGAAYPLYAAMLEGAPADFGARLHESAVSPVSQYLCGDRWQVSLFGADAIGNLSPVLEAMDRVFLRREQTGLDLHLEERVCIGSVEELLDRELPRRGVLRLQTPTAFKSGGVYQLLPTQRLVMQSLILKWNGCFGDECPIEDDGGGLEALAQGLRYRSVRLDTRDFPMKHTRIPGVLGEIEYENSLSGFHRQLSNALLTFGTYSGIGIKTTLGMGGLQITTK